MATKQKTVMIVEDDLFTLKLYSYRFEADGYLVIRTPDAKAVLELAASHKPNLFIVDIMLQDGNGFDIIKLLRKTPGFKKTPILVMSNLGQESDIAEAMNAGATDYFVKSNVRLQEVIEKAEGLMKKPTRKK